MSARQLSLACAGDSRKPVHARSHTGTYRSTSKGEQAAGRPPAVGRQTRPPLGRLLVEQGLQEAAMSGHMTGAGGAAIAGAAMLLSLAAIPAHAWELAYGSDPVVPLGSYLESCTDARMWEGRLVAD